MTIPFVKSGILYTVKKKGKTKMTFENLFSKVQRIQDRMSEDRRNLHSMAETGMALPLTTKNCLDRLQRMGYSPKCYCEGGIVCTVGKGERCVLLRADMDALPIKEESGETFSSRTDAMHACGHDMHTAMLLGAAQLLWEHEKDLQVTVKLCFQPGEETLSGAVSMIDAGLLSSPDVDCAMMIHVLAATDYPCGTVIIPPSGVGAAGADFFTIYLRGKGCHGATPHLGIDPITAGAQLITLLSGLISREIGQGGGDVLSIGRIHAGDSDNAIPDCCILGGTLRSYDDEHREFIKSRLTETARFVAKAHRADSEVVFTSGCPSFINDPHLCKRAAELFCDASPAPFIVPEGMRGGGSEDFSYVSRKVPSIMLALSAGEKDKGYLHPLHSPKVRFDESALPYGAAAYAAFALGMDTK